MPSGFHAYWVYCAVKMMHFGSSKYDITKMGLPRKEMFLNKWNTDRKDKDGLLFQKFMQQMPRLKDHYIRCFSRYWLNDPNFHISHVLNDKMSLYKRNELELDAIVDTVRGDFVSALNYCHNKGMNYGQMFGHYKGNAPFVLRLYDRGKISVNSIVAMNLAFNYQDINPDKKPDIMTGLNPIDQEKMKMWTKIFVEYYKVVYNYFQDRNWNIFFKELYNSFQA
jgi:hypothetical protein